MPIAFRSRSAPEKSGPPPPQEAIDKFQEFFESESASIAHQAFQEVLRILDIKVDRFQKCNNNSRYPNVTGTSDKKVNSRPMGEMEVMNHLVN